MTVHDRWGTTSAARTRRLVAGLALAASALASGACDRTDLAMKQAQENAERAARHAAPRAIGGGPSAMDESRLVVADVAEIAGAPAAEAESYDGAPAELSYVLVQSVASDRAFWIGPSASQQILAVLSPQGAVTLKPGDLVSVRGTVRRIGDKERAKAEWHLDAAKGGELDGSPIYVDVNHVDVLGP